MFDSIQTIVEYLEAVIGYEHGMDFAGQYGEPGYGDSDTQLVVLGYYWCRCDKFVEEDGTYADGTVKLHDIARHYPHTFRKLEELGVEFHWQDEWIVDHANDKAYRTEPDSYSWQPSYVMTEDGELLTADDDIDVWIDWAKNNDRLCIPANIATGADLIGVGFEEFNGTFESGWHPGQTDDPARIYNEIRDQYGDDVDIVFALTETSQFYIKFEAYYRSTEEV